MITKTTLFILCVAFGVVLGAESANDSARIDISTMSREDIMKLSNKDLVNLSFEDLQTLADKMGVSVDDLLNMKVSVSSKKALSPRESPGIISVVTDEEIRNSGARDLVDVLRLVPGFEFGADVEGVTGIGVRGMWAQEGKVLLLVDGQEMNELSYSDLPVGGRFDVNNIKRVEILRGPGSCVYGGFAELSVINIITKKSDDINGVTANVAYGQEPSSFGFTNGSLQAGKFFKDGDFTMSLFGNTGYRSDQNYTYDGYTFSGNNDLLKLNSANANVGGSYKNLFARFIYDYYTTGSFDGDTDAAGAPVVYPTEFRSYLGELHYDWQINDQLTVTPKINYKGQSSWENDEPTDYLYNVFVSRYTGNVLANYDPLEYLNIIGGVEGYLDAAKQYANTYDTFPNGKTDISYTNEAAFGQALLKSKYLNLIVGGRIDHNNAFGWAYSPRLGLTGLFDRFHFKAIFSKAFRAPGIEDIRIPKIVTGMDIKPERTTDAEAELGYQLTDNMFLTANIFDISISDPIIYLQDSLTGNDEYVNYPKTGTGGAELEYRTKFSWGYTTLNYSYYDNKWFDFTDWKFERNAVPQYMVPSDSSALLGFAQHKLTLNICYETGNFSIDPSLSFLSKRYMELSDGTYGAASPLYLLNIYLRYTFPSFGLGLGAGVYDVLNQQYQFIQPYGSDTPIPGPAREIVAKITYDLK